MYNALDKEFSGQIENTLRLAVSQLVNTNQSEWMNYVPSPLRFIYKKSNNFFGIDDEFIDLNLDYLLDKLEVEEKIFPTWQWGKYPAEWEIAKSEWMGILTLEGLLSLMKFNRI